MHFMRINENVEIKELTTMRLGGLARYVIELETVEDVDSVVEVMEAEGLIVG